MMKNFFVLFLCTLYHYYFLLLNEACPYIYDDNNKINKMSLVDMKWRIYITWVWVTFSDKSFLIDFHFRLSRTQAFKFLRKARPWLVSILKFQFTYDDTKEKSRVMHFYCIINWHSAYIYTVNSHIVVVISSHNFNDKNKLNHF